MLYHTIAQWLHSAGTSLAFHRLKFHHLKLSLHHLATSKLPQIVRYLPVGGPGQTSLSDRSHVTCVGSTSRADKWNV